MMSLENRVVVISGASGGLGRVVASYMAEHGANLVLLGRSIERLTNLADELSLLNENHLILAIDLGDLGAAEAAAHATLKKFGKIDIILQLVGGWSGGQSVIELELDNLSDMLQQHAWTTIHLAQAFLPHMLNNGWGRIVAISSPFAAAPRAKGAPYAMGKAAQEALILTLAQELNGSGVTANILLVKTIDLDHKRELEPSPRNASWSTPEEIAEAILY
ncbi:SDR family NAD(P)-dependent oxidoreductase, partial [Chloroflexota bacterium]